MYINVQLKSSSFRIRKLIYLVVYFVYGVYEMNTNTTPNQEGNRAQVILNPGDWIRSDGSCVIINSCKTYNLKYTELLGVNETQKAIINKILGSMKKKPIQKPNAKKTNKPLNKEELLKQELKSLENITLLKKKITTCNNFKEKLLRAQARADQDEEVINSRKLRKHILTASKYYNNLIEDKNIAVSKITDTVYKIVYTGQFVNSTHQGTILFSGVL